MANYDERLQARLRHLGDRIREERTRRGLSQEELAHRAGLHRTYIGSVERGERNITVGNVHLIADTLGLHAGELLDDAPPANAHTPIGTSAGETPRLQRRH